MMFGLDLLGLAKYPKVARENFPQGFALGVFSSAFGDSREAVDAILSTGRCPRVRVHLMWKDAHDFRRSDFPLIAKEAQRWRDLIDKHFRVQWEFSGACEHRLNGADARELASKVLQMLPGRCEYVNTPMSGGADVEGARVINERHGAAARSKGGRENFSFDGSPAVDCDVETIKRTFRDASTFYLWEPRFNGRWEDNDTTPRPKRRGWPDAKLLQSVIALAGECGDVGLPKKWIYKSHSENHGDGSRRSEKPVMISPVQAPMIALKRPGGAVVERLTYYGPYEGGGHRYYSKRWGFEIAQEPLEVWANNKKCGKVNPVFRCGTFRN